MSNASVLEEIRAGLGPEDLHTPPEGPRPRRAPRVIPEPPAELARLVGRLVKLRKEERKALRQVSRAERRAHMLEDALASVDEAIRSFLLGEMGMAARIDPETDFAPALVIGSHAVVLQKPRGKREHWMAHVLPVSHQGPAVDMK